MTGIDLDLVVAVHHHTLSPLGLVVRFGIDELDVTLIICVVGNLVDDAWQNVIVGRG